MADREQDGHEVLILYRVAYNALNTLNDKLVDLSKEALGKEHENKRVTMSALLGELKQMHAGLNCLHHSIGHLFFGRCWTEVAVGDEFKPTVLEELDKELSELLVGLGIQMKLLDPENLPADLNPEVRATIKNHQQALKNASKAHLH